MGTQLNYVRTTLEEKVVFNLLSMSDKDFMPALSSSMDIKQYAHKLATCAQFIIVLKQEQIVGFVAYYLNDEGQFIYVPLIWVSSLFQRQGVGKQLIQNLVELSLLDYKCIKLEVLKTNVHAIMFYKNEQFEIAEDRGEKYLLIKSLQNHKVE